MANEQTAAKKAAAAPDRVAVIQVLRDGFPDMFGAGAPDDMDQAHRTQAWLAVSNDPAAMRSGRYFYHLEERAANPEAHDPALARRLLDRCAAFSKIELPS